MATSANGAAVDLSKIPKQSKAGQMALQGLASAGSAVAGALVGMAISKGIELLDHWINRQEYAKEALADSVSAYDSVTNEVNSLQESLTVCRDRLSQLQSLASNGTISVIEQKELDALQQQNDELERQVALKQAKQIDTQKETLEDIDDVVNGKVSSQYQTYTLSSTPGQMYGQTYAKSVTRDEELISGVEEYNRLLDLQKQNPDFDYSIQLENTSERIKEMYDDFSPGIEAYEKLIASGSKLTAEEQARYEQLKKSQEAYLQYNYAINGTKEAFEALNEEQQRVELQKRLTESGMSSKEADLILNSMKSDDINKLWNKDLFFTVPQRSEFESTEAYTRAYANNWLNAANKENSIYGENVSFDQIWSGIDNDEDSTFKKLKSDLTSLAEKGQLTLSTFKATDNSATFLEQIGLSAEEAVNKINQLTDSSQQLGTLKSGISSLQNAYSEKSENGIVGAETLSSMSKTFGNLGDSWTKYEQIAGSANSTTEDLEKAQNELASAYINSNNFLSGLVDETGKCTDANRQFYISQLESLGIKNAENIVDNSIMQQKANLALQSVNLASATTDEIQALANENNQLGASNDAFQNYIFYKALASENALDTTSSIQNLIALAEQCEGTGAVVSHLMSLLGAKEEYERLTSSGAYIPADQASGLRETIEYETKWLENNSATNTKKVDTKKTKVNPPKQKNTNNVSTSSTKQEIDWIDRRITTLTSKIGLLNSQKENLFSVKKKNNNLNEQIKKTTSLINSYTAAYQKYMSKANAVKLSAKLKKKVQNGQITGNYYDLIEEYGGTTAEQIESYKKYYDQAQSAKKNLAEAKTSKRQLKIEKHQNYVDKYDALSNYNHLMAENTSRTAKKRNKYIEKEKKNLKKSYSYQIKIAKLNKNITEQKRLQEERQQKLVELSKQEFDNIAKKYERKIQKQNYKISNYDNEIAEIEASGATVNRSYYDSKKTVNNQILAQYKAEQTALEKKLPKIKKGTDEYYDALDAIQACKDGISGCIQTTYELNTAINDLQFNQFDKIAEKISRITDEQDFLQNLFSHEKMTDEETGNFTDAGLAKLGSVSTNYYAAKEKAANSSELLKTLKNVKNKGKQANGTYKLGEWEFNSLEVLEAKIDETYDTWRDNLKETYEYESEIADMMKDKYQAELDLLQDLIDAKKEALQAEKDLHDYQRTITEKTRDISTIQKQIAAYSGDTSQEGLAKLQKLQKELAEKQEDLRETEYEKYISDQEDMLDKLYEEYEKLVTKKLDDFYKLVDEGLATANSNTSIIVSYIKEVAQKNGYTIENDGVVKDGDISNNVGNTVANIENKEKTSSGSTGTSSGKNLSGYASPIISDSNGIIYDRNKNKDMKKYAIRFIKENATPAKKAYHQYADLNRAIYTNSKNVFGFGDKKKVLKVEKMKELASDMGFIYDNSTKSGALYQKLLAVGIPGFKHGGIGELVKAQGEDGIALVRNGEGFISPENVPAIKELVNNIPFMNEFTQSLIKSPGLSGITPLSNVGNNIEANYNFTLENCNNAEDIIYQIQTSAKIQKAIQSVSVDRIAGGGRLGVHRIK